MHEPPPTSGDPPRRSFIAHLAAGLLAGVAILAPLATGVVALLSPLRRGPAAGNFRRVTTLEAVPADGRPYRFTVVADRSDAWSHYSSEPVGTIYLRRDVGNDLPVAFSATCPHLGCQVGWKESATRFHCPCHNASFAADGVRTEGDKSPSPRDLDTLAVELRNGNEVWVDYRVFKSSRTEKIAV